MQSRIATGTVAALAAACVALTGCSGDPAGPGKPELVTKLKSDADFNDIKGSGTPAQFDAYVNCIADYFLSKARKKDLVQYVAGTKKRTDIKGDDSETNAKSQGQRCYDTAYPPSGPAATPTN